MRISINKADHRLMLTKATGYTLQFLSLSIWHGDRGTQAKETYHYSFRDMEGSHEGARPTAVIA